jgi:dTDP-4-amino-4,6-dideoxygalactose transaminase
MIPFIDLKTQFKHLEKEIHARIDTVLEHGKYIMGPEVKELEEREIERICRIIGNEISPTEVIF